MEAANQNQKFPFYFLSAPPTPAENLKKGRKIFGFVPRPKGADEARSFVQFPLEKGSRKVYDYSTSSNLFGIRNMERFCRSQNRAVNFFKTLSAYGGSREIP